MRKVLKTGPLCEMLPIQQKDKPYTGRSNKQCGRWRMVSGHDPFDKPKDPLNAIIG